MSSDGDDCAALTQQISETLNCDDPKECCQSYTDQNEDTQNRADDPQEKSLGEENSREVVRKTVDFPDGVIAQTIETDSDRKGIDYSQFLSKYQEEGGKIRAEPCSLFATVAEAYNPRDTLNDEEDDEKYDSHNMSRDEEHGGDVVAVPFSLSATVTMAYTPRDSLNDEEDDEN